MGRCCVSRVRFIFTYDILTLNPRSRNRGILVPGGFGTRGTEGMILAIKWAREQNVPFLGICLGFQLAVIEWLRHVCGQKNATSGEFDPNAQDPAIIFMPEISKTHMGGTMRLGLRPTVFDATSDWSKLRKLYKGADKIWERHRHRYEVNPALIEKITSAGLPFIGKDEKGERMQVLELPGMFLRISMISFSLTTRTRNPTDHHYFVGLQAHPEFCTRPLNPSPPFLGFVAAACGPAVLQEQIEHQLKNFIPPHPEGSMVNEEQLRQASPVPRGKEVIMAADQ
jgi:CTP synthase